MNIVSQRLAFGGGGRALGLASVASIGMQHMFVIQAAKLFIQTQFM
jgi:hypothetical protein